ncbi:MAG TPA: sialidase family protein [Bacteroidales bacterium]|nr:sialidase family protein [Bacteroidales bacterium]HRZ48999.1 sialidase family protein [Bacteroidales bacterium]
MKRVVIIAILLVMTQMLSAQWKKIWSLPEKSNDYISCACYMGGNILVTSAISGVLVSSDNGITFKESNKGLKTDTSVKKGEFGYYPNFYYLVAAGSDIIATCGTTGVYRSVDKGVCWNEATRGIADPKDFRLSSNQKVVFGSGSDQILYRWNSQTVRWDSVTDGISDFAVNEIGLFVSVGGSLYRSVDQGETWDEILFDPGNPDQEMYAWNSQESPGDGVSIQAAGKYVLANCCYQSVIMSSDSGSTWKSLNTNYIGGIANSGKMLFITPELYEPVGIMKSADGGKTWKTANTGLPPGYIQDREIFPVSRIFISGKDLFAIYRGNELWRRPLAELMAP